MASQALKTTTNVLIEYISTVLLDRGWERIGTSESYTKGTRKVDLKPAMLEGTDVIMYDESNIIATLPLMSCLDNPLFHYFIK